MPVILILVLATIAAFYAVIIALPMTTSWLAVTLLGRRAKITKDEQSKLLTYFYFIMGGYAVAGMILTQAAEGWELIISIPMLFFLWPIGMGFAMIGVASDTMEAWITFGLAYATVQIIAIFMVLRRADEDTRD